MNASNRYPEASLAQVQALDTRAAVDVLCRGLGREVRRVGFEKVVLGVSGGLDSALVAYLAAKVFGAENVIMVCMPYTTSNPDSLAHGQLVARELGAPAHVEAIGPQIDAYFERHGDASEMRRGNKMARERMTILYDYSVEHRALVLGTSNKTELLLGYSTVFGDSACAIMPIGDLYKTQARSVSRFLGVPDVIVEKAPSADLWEGQTDEEELGYTYAQADALLYEMVDRRKGRATLVDMGFDAEFVDEVQRRVRNNQFKRKMPVILKLSARTIDKDFLYPRDWTG